MIPHEHAPLTARELTVLAELEHDLADIPLPSEATEPTSSWPHQLAGVIVVVVSTLLLAGLVHAGAVSALIVMEAAVGVLGLAAGAIIAIDPARRFLRSAPTRGAQRWAHVRRRLVERRATRRRLAERRPRMLGRR